MPVPDPATQHRNDGGPNTFGELVVPMRANRGPLPADRGAVRENPSAVVGSDPMLYVAFDAGVALNLIRLSTVGGGRCSLRIEDGKFFVQADRSSLYVVLGAAHEDVSSSYHAFTCNPAYPRLWVEVGAVPPMMSALSEKGDTLIFRSGDRLVVPDQVSLPARELTPLRQGSELDRQSSATPFPEIEIAVSLRRSISGTSVPNTAWLFESGESLASELYGPLRDHLHSLHCAILVRTEQGEDRDSAPNSPRIFVRMTGGRSAVPLVAKHLDAVALESFYRMPGCDRMFVPSGFEPTVPMRPEAATKLFEERLGIFSRTLAAGCTTNVSVATIDSLQLRAVAEVLSFELPSAVVLAPRVIANPFELDSFTVEEPPIETVIDPVSRDEGEAMARRLAQDAASDRQRALPEAGATSPSAAPTAPAVRLDEPNYVESHLRGIASFSLASIDVAAVNHLVSAAFSTDPATDAPLVSAVRRMLTLSAPLEQLSSSQPPLAELVDIAVARWSAVGGQIRRDDSLLCGLLLSAARIDSEFREALLRHSYELACVWRSAHPYAPLRLQWLAECGLSRLSGGDELGLARARDRIVRATRRIGEEVLYELPPDCALGLRSGPIQRRFLGDALRRFEEVIEADQDLNAARWRAQPAWLEDLPRLFLDIGFIVAGECERVSFATVQPSTKVARSISRLIEARRADLGSRGSIRELGGASMVTYLDAEADLSDCVATFQHAFDESDLLGARRGEDVVTAFRTNFPPYGRTRDWRDDYPATREQRDSRRVQQWTMFLHLASELRAAEHPMVLCDALDSCEGKGPQHRHNLDFGIALVKSCRAVGTAEQLELLTRSLIPATIDHHAVGAMKSDFGFSHKAVRLILETIEACEERGRLDLLAAFRGKLGLASANARAKIRAVKKTGGFARVPDSEYAPFVIEMLAESAMLPGGGVGCLDTHFASIVDNRHRSFPLSVFRAGILAAARLPRRAAGAAIEQLFLRAMTSHGGDSPAYLVDSLVWALVEISRASSPIAKANVRAFKRDTRDRLRMSDGM